MVDAASVRVEPGDRPTAGSVRPIVGHVPLVGLDWGQVAFGVHTVLDVRLGPVPGALAAIDPGAEVRTVGGAELRRSPLGASKSVEWRVTGDPRRADRTIYGTIADRSVIGWPWEALYAAWAGETLSQVASAEAFENAIVARFGRPSFVAAGVGRDLTRYWTYDLDGRQLGAEAAPGGRLFATIDDWIAKELHTYAADLGNGPLTWEGQRG